MMLCIANPLGSSPFHSSRSISPRNAALTASDAPLFRGGQKIRHGLVEDCALDRIKLSLPRRSEILATVLFWSRPTDGHVGADLSHIGCVFGGSTGYSISEYRQVTFEAPRMKLATFAGSYPTGRMLKALDGRKRVPGE
jgi:hypothetical protein